MKIYGSVCYYYKSPYIKLYLFTGDSYFNCNCIWSTFIVNNYKGTTKYMINSLKKLRKLKPDVVISSGFIGEVSHDNISNEEWLNAIESSISKLID